VKAIARGFAWLEQLLSGNGDTIASIARRERITGRYVSRIIELAFLDPQMVEAALKGALVLRVSTKRLVLDVSLPLAWSEQLESVAGPA
jgi:site-specific DNA recombinase